MLGITQSVALMGVDARPIQVEVNTGEAGELKFILVGLPDAAVEESQDSAFSAMTNLPNKRDESLPVISCVEHLHQFHDTLPFAGGCQCDLHRVYD